MRRGPLLMGTSRKNNDLQFQFVRLDILISAVGTRRSARPVPAILGHRHQARVRRRARADSARSSSTATDMSQSMQPSVMDWP